MKETTLVSKGINKQNQTLDGMIEGLTACGSGVVGNIARSLESFPDDQLEKLRKHVTDELQGAHCEIAAVESNGR